MHILSRRQFLLGAAALSLLVSASVTVPQIGSYPEHDLPTKVLRPKHVHIYRILGDWLIPPNTGMPGSGGDDKTIIAIDALFHHIPEEHEVLLLALPLVFEHGTALDRFGASRLSALSSEEIDAYMRGWATSSHLVSAQLFAALRTLFGLSYFERLDVQQAISMPSPCAV